MKRGERVGGCMSCTRLPQGEFESGRGEPIRRVAGDFQQGRRRTIWGGRPKAQDRIRRLYLETTEEKAARRAELEMLQF